MAENESNANGNASANGVNTVNNNGASRAAFEMPSTRMRPNFLQHGIGKRVTSGPDYATPPNRNVRILHCVST